jgi:hypothetical protein
MTHHIGAVFVHFGTRSPGDESHSSMCAVVSTQSKS